MIIAGFAFFALSSATVAFLKRSTSPVSNSIQDRKFNLSHVPAVHDAHSFRVFQQQR